MKTKIMPILLFVGVVVLSVLSSLGTYYYLGDQLFPEQKDTVVVADSAAAQPDLAFTSIEQVLQDRHLCKEYALYDSIYRVIPEDLLMNIAKIIIARQGSATVKDIAEEFMRNYKITFQRTEVSAPETTANTHTPDTVVESEVPKIPNTKDTVIDGRRVTIMLQ